MIEIQPLSRFSPEERTQLWNECFQGYALDMTLDEQRFTARMSKNGLSSSLSLVGLLEDRPAGFVLSGTRLLGGVKTAWNGGTAVSPSFRGRSVGRTLMEAALKLYRRERVKQATLEVIADNHPALHLYTRLGFQKTDRLRSFQRSGSIPRSREPACRIRSVSSKEVSTLSFYHHEAPWQTQWESNQGGESLILYGPEGEPAGYALYRKALDKNGRTKSVTLLQCRIKPGRVEGTPLIRTLLSHLVDPEDREVHFTVINQPESNTLLLKELQRTGFIPWLPDQWAMVCKLS